MSVTTTKWLPIFFNLQFFADGGASGGGGDGGGEGGAETGVSTGAADRTLEDLGVPAEKAERFRQRKAKAQPPVVQEVEQPDQEPAAEEPAQNPTIGWDEFMALPENQQRLQAMMAERGRKATEEREAAAQTMQKLNPALELIASRYGIEAVDGQYDLDEIVRSVTNDDSYYEKRAEDLGVDVDVAKQLEMANMERRRAEAQAEAMRRQQEKQERDFQLRQHFNRMQQEATKLKEIFPDFDLNKELQDPVFLQRTSPEGGMSVTDAFYSIHHDAIMQQQAEAIARRAKADVAAAVRSGVRPKENGGSAMATVSATPNIKQMTRDERRAYIMQKYRAP